MSLFLDLAAHPTSETERLTLRPISFEDWPQVLAIYSDEETGRYNAWSVISSKKEAVQRIQNWKEQQERDVRIRWAIVEKESNLMIGDMAFVGFDLRMRKGEIGFNLNRDYWQKGIMHEALNGLLKIGFEHYQLNRIEAIVNPDNQACRKLLAKLGFKEEATVRELGYKNGQYFDLLLISLLKREWTKA